MQDSNMQNRTGDWHETLSWLEAKGIMSIKENYKENKIYKLSIKARTCIRSRLHLRGFLLIPCEVWLLPSYLF